jgi:hypothetical protein
MGVWVIVIMLFMVVGFGVYVSALMQTIEQQNAQLTRLRTEADLARTLAGLLDTADMRTALLHSHQPSVRGQLLWTPSEGTALLRVSGLDSGRLYQLWLVEKGEPRSIAAFSVPSPEPHLVRIDSSFAGRPHEGDSFIVTIEREGGASAPTGLMVLAGSPDH